MITFLLIGVGIILMVGVAFLVWGTGQRKRSGMSGSSDVGSSSSELPQEPRSSTFSN